MTWLTWIPRLIWFGLWFTKVLVVSNVTVISDNLTPGQRSQPGIAEVRTRCRTDYEVTLLATLISLTPGTLALAHQTVEPMRASMEHHDTHVRVLYVHGMYNAGPDDLRASLADMERRMLSAIRREGFTS